MFATHRSFTLETGVKNSSIAVLNTPTRTGCEVSVIYHKTVVVQTKGSKIILANGGWDTVSTRAVINRALAELGTPATFLYRKKGQTYLASPGGDVPFNGCAVIRAVRKQPADQVGAVYSFKVAS